MFSMEPLSAEEQAALDRIADIKAKMVGAKAA